MTIILKIITKNLIKYKNGADKQKNWNKLAKQARDDKRSARQMKKINERNK